jgi:hypothetical protein
LLHDRDASYGVEFRSRVEAMNITEVITAPRSPWQNAYVERVIGSIRRECLDRLGIFNERHLRGVMSSYIHYHQHTRTAPFARQGLPRLSADSASQRRQGRRHSKSRWLASSLRTSHRPIRVFGELLIFKQNKQFAKDWFPLLFGGTVSHSRLAKFVDLKINQRRTYNSSA